MPTSDSNANIARHLPAMAARQPDRAAIKIPRGRTRTGGIDYLVLSFAELDAEVNAWSERLRNAGVQQGDRTLVMVKQGLPLIAAAFALFKVGAVPVIIDPGMGLKSYLSCVRRSRPRVLLGIPLARVVSRFFPGAFRSVAVRVAANGSLTSRLGGPSHLATTGRADSVVATAADELAAVLFTSGSTGPAKGVRYEHGMFDAQVRLIQATYAIEPGEIDLPMLPIFALFNPALGMTTIVPEIDPRRPGAVDPARIVRAIQQENVTNSFGSPTLWRKIGAHCESTGTSLPTLKRVLCAGAPVPAGLWVSAPRWMPRGVLHSPYGATEALPIATIAGTERTQLTGSGACVGRPVAEIQVKVIAIVDGPIGTLAEAGELPAGEIGEIVVGGPVVTKAYDEAAATAAAKMIEYRDGRAVVWHRMGDCGYRDRDGRVWFSGRKVERVVTTAATLHTEPCEQVFREHPHVSRCALIGLGERGRQIPALVVEGAPTNAEAARVFAAELRALGGRHAPTAAITRFFFRAKFPVDVRHNAKIHRLALARWAATARAIEVRTAA